MILYLEQLHHRVRMLSWTRRRAINSFLRPHFGALQLRPQSDVRGGDLIFDVNHYYFLSDLIIHAKIIRFRLKVVCLFLSLFL